MSDTAHTEATFEQAPAAESPGVLQQARWLAIGLLATLGEQTTRAAEALIQKGRTTEPRVVEPVKRAASDFSGAAGTARERMKQAASNLAGARRTAAGSPAGPTAEEFQKLKAEVEELRARLTAERAASGPPSSPEHG